MVLLPWGSWSRVRALSREVTKTLGVPVNSEPLCNSGSAVSDSQQVFLVQCWSMLTPPVGLSGRCSALSQKGDSSPSPFTRPKMSWRTRITSGCGQKPSTILQVSSREPHTRYRARLELLGWDSDVSPLLRLTGAAKGSHRGSREGSAAAAVPGREQLEVWELRTAL